MTVYQIQLLIDLTKSPIALFLLYIITTANKLCGMPPQYAPTPVTLTFDLLTLKVVPESRVTWATSMPILVFLGLSVLDLGPMYSTDRRQTASSINAPA